MKTVSSLFAALGLLFATTAAAQPLDLQLEWFYSNAPGYESGERTHLFGARDGDNYSVTADFYLESLSVEDATLSIYWYDAENNLFAGGGGSGYIEADSDVSFLDASVDLPPGATGTIWVEFSIYFVDGSTLSDFRYVVIE